MRTLIILLAVIAVPCSAAEQPWVKRGFVASCDSPNGPEISYGWLEGLSGKTLQSPADGFKTGRDGFSNMNPVFVYNPKMPSRLRSLWGSTRPKGVSKELLDALAQKKWENLKIVNVRDNFVTAISSYPKEVWLTTLVPSLGVALSYAPQNQ